MRTLLIPILIAITYSNGSGQVICSGPLNIKVYGSGTGRPLNIDSEVYDLFCKSFNEGSIELLIDGGNPEYECLWNNGMNDENLVGLEPGVYSVTVTDKANCQDTMTIRVNIADPEIDELELCKENGCGSCYLADGDNSYFYYLDKYMLNLDDIKDDHDLGFVQVCNTMHNENLYLDYNEKLGTYEAPALSRSWDIQSDGGNSSTTLYFHNSELQKLLDMVDDPITNSKALGVMTYMGGQRTHLNYKYRQRIDELTLTLFDNVDSIWAVQFHMPDLPEEMGVYLFYDTFKPSTELTEDEIIENHTNGVVYRSVSAEAEKIKNLEITILGNPVIDRLNFEISVSDPEPIPCHYSITNTSGQVMLSEQYSEITPGIKEYDVSQFISGTYFLKIDFPNQNLSKTYKIIKVNL